MGQAERRALCAVVADIFADVFAAHVAPHQVAIGVRCGAERLAYGVRATLEANPHWAALQLDAANAFNSWCRALVSTELANAPELRPLVPLVSKLVGPGAPLAFGGGAAAEGGDGGGGGGGDGLSAREDEDGEDGNGD